MREKRTNNKFVFPVGAMRKIFKGYFMQHLRLMFSKNQLSMAVNDFETLLTTIGYKRWNVYAKSFFGGPMQVIQYLGRYTHKVAITHHRIISLEEGKITFRYMMVINRKS